MICVHTSAFSGFRVRRGSGFAYRRPVHAGHPGAGPAAGLFLAVLLVLSQAGFASAQETGSGEWYQGKPIQEIVFTNLKNVKESELEGVTEPFIGTIFTDEVFQEILGRLYALEYFEFINPSALASDSLGSGVILRFEVTERPKISRINFTGNSHLRRNELLDTITLKVNDLVNQAKLRVDEEAVRAKYVEKGYPDVKVRSETRPVNDGTMVVNFYIEEGEKIVIRNIRFEGNTVFSNRALKGKLSLKVKNILNDGAFQEAKLAADQAAITQYYHDRGYIDAQVTDVVRNMIRNNKGENNLTIIFRIYEGRIYTFGGVTFEGNEIFSTEQLSKLIYSKVGETANGHRIETDLQRVADLYFENGYINNTIGREEIRDSGRGIISYRIPIVERGRAHIESISVRGNEKTKTSVILREIPLEPGDVFSKTKVMDGIRNLYNLQYFSVVAPDTPQGSADNLMDLVFNVEEQPTTDIQFGLTFSGTADPEAFPISGMVKWNDRNVRGGGNMMGAEVIASPDNQGLTLSYTHRWILGLPLSGGFDFSVRHAQRLGATTDPNYLFNGDETYAFPAGFKSYAEYDDAGKIPPDEYLMTYDQWYFSLGFSTGYRWSTFLGNLGVGGGVRIGLIYNSYDAGLYRPFDPTLREDNNRLTPSNSFYTNVYLDQRDVYYDPTKGYYGIQRFGIYGILGSEREHYLKADTRAEYFYPLLQIPITDNYTFKTIFGIHTGVSFIVKQAFRDLRIENTNKLSVDGMFIGRGWSNEYNRKGLVLWENWAELRFPIVPNILAWDFFFDAAAVKETPTKFFREFSIDDMRFSFGGGLRFSIPQFPFRFSLAKRFRTEGGDFKWVKGAIGSNSNPASGIDFVISFALSNY
ncbi:MAG: outer membrane protein assembly factor BamA [Treponema sp.]|jgi:outer membrane protein insertion porin family|nr:outer membrane protein assembly factor BamA [Treponema sp.]